MQQVNLYQDQFKSKPVIFPARQVVLVILLTITIMVVISFFSSQRVTTQNQILSEQQYRLGADQSQLTTLQQTLSQTAKNPLLDAELIQLQLQLQQKQTVLDYLQNNNFGNHHGFASKLVSLSEQRIENVWLTEFSLLNGGDYIALYGSSLDSTLIPEYIDSLAKSEQFKGKQFSIFQIQQPNDGTGHYHFKLHTQQKNAGITP